MTMGTQFSSRLSDKDAREILERIASAFSKRLVDKSAKKWIESSLKKKRAPEGKKDGRTARVSAPPKSVTSLSGSDKRVLGDATVGEVLAVAESHDFYACLTASTLFTTSLEWLYTVWSDGKFNGLNKTLAKYELDEAQSPLAELSRRLAALAATSDKDMKDPLHGAAVNAAKAVLAEVAATNVSKKPGESPARALGRQFKEFHVNQIATKFVAVYIKGVVKPMLEKVDEGGSGGIAQEAIRLANGTAERIARRVLDRAAKAGVIDKPKAIREIAIDELKQLRTPKPSTHSD
jgi:hypothetical protein